MYAEGASSRPGQVIHVEAVSEVVRAVEKPQVFFTSDTHFGHYNIIELCKRPINRHNYSHDEALQKMEDLLVSNWNSVVSPRDTIYHLGDFFWCNGREAARILARLNGNIHWIKGNHDSNNHINHCRPHLSSDPVPYLEASFEVSFIDDQGEQREWKQPVVMCHFPILSWNQMAHGSWMLHGHCHGSLGTEKGLRYDVGVDYHENNWTPVSVSDLATRMALRTVVPVDYHRPKQ